MEIDETLLRKYAQDDYYVTSWHTLDQHDTHPTQFNLYAFLFGMTWCFYRKLYWLGIISFLAGIIAATASIGLVCILSTCNVPVSELIYKIISLLAVFICVRIPLGLAANKLYYKEAIKTIEKHFSNPTLSDEDRAFHIEIEGGTSLGGLVIALIISITFRLIT